ncbi:unnamed protein product, partial [Linum tenue]
MVEPRELGPSSALFGSTFTTKEAERKCLPTKFLSLLKVDSTVRVAWSTLVICSVAWLTIPAV